MIEKYVFFKNPHDITYYLIDKYTFCVPRFVFHVPCSVFRVSCFVFHGDYSAKANNQFYHSHAIIDLQKVMPGTSGIFYVSFYAYVVMFAFYEKTLKSTAYVLRFSCVRFEVFLLPYLVSRGLPEGYERVA